MRDGERDRGPCGKRNFRSKQAARDATRHVHHRLRVYFCRLCGGWHVTNRDKPRK